MTATKPRPRTPEADENQKDGCRIAETAQFLRQAIFRPDSWPWLNPERREGDYTRFSARNVVRPVYKPVQAESEIASAERRVKPLARLLRCATALRVTAPLGCGSRRPVWPKGSFRPVHTARMPRFGAWCDAIERYQMRYKITGGGRRGGCTASRSAAFSHFTCDHEKPHGLPQLA